MKQEKPNRKCESCRTEIKVLDLCQEPNLILCELCKPWVLSSIYQVPRRVIDIDIEDPSLFEISLKLTENFSSPSTESDWYKFLKFIFSKKSGSSDEESEMLTKIRLDYAGRNAIYSQEAHDLYYGPQFDPDADYSWDELEELSPYNGNHPFFDDPTVHFDFMADLNSIINRYIESLNTIEEEKRLLQENGWGGYAEQIIWNEIEPQIHNLYGTELSTSQFLECIDLVKSSRSVQYGLMAQVIFDFACDESKMSLESRINQISTRSEILDQFNSENPPTSPFYYHIIADLVQGKYGQNLQYLMLASLYQWQRTLRPSHSFLVRDENVWSKSFQLLRGIIDSLGLKRANIKSDKILIKGDSDTWYSIKPARFRTELQWWIVSNAKTGVGICIDILVPHKDLPLGDQLSSVVLALANDGSIVSEVSTLDPDRVFRGIQPVNML
ncbi:MAG: hypothetical protein DWB99_03475 [Candidatus Poseidoniales archaeon]|nr:MAG: hypothetical protein DWB99_03475 [Candidatus Poseidoniales archaeon]